MRLVAGFLQQGGHLLPAPAPAVAKLALGLGAPLLAAAVWGTFVAPKAAVSLDMPLRLVPEALVFGAAVAALFATGHPLPAVCLAVLAAVNRALVLAWE